MKRINSNSKLIVALFLAFLFVTNTIVAADFTDRKEVKIFQISFEQEVDRQFNDLLLRKAEGFIKYQWEPEGLYIIMEKNTSDSALTEVLKAVNFNRAFKISDSRNRMLPTKYLEEKN